MNYGLVMRLFNVFLFYILFSLFCYGQENESESGYQLIMMNNPAFSGSEGDGVVRLSYISYLPGNNYNLNSVFFSYDSYIPSLHGGISVYFSDDYLGGIINEMKGGVSYAYFLQAGKDLYINAGLSASVFNRGFNFSDAVLPDQIDPLAGAIFPSSELLVNSGKTVFDIGAGFLFITGNMFGGFSVSHLAEPDMTESPNYTERLKRKFLTHLVGNIDLKNNIRIRPMGYSAIQGGHFSAGGGAEIESKYLSISALLLGFDNNLNVQTGFSINTGKLSVYYNYRFNALSGNSMMPFSLLHQTGLAFSLNNVDKRKTIKTINFPKL